MNKAKRRFEYTHEASNKFWEIELNGDSYTTWYGKIYSNPRNDTNTFESPEKTLSEYERIIKEKLQKGYVEIKQNGGSNMNTISNIKISTKNLSALPSPEELYKRCIALVQLSKLLSICLDPSFTISDFSEYDFMGGGEKDDAKVFCNNNQCGDYLWIVFKGKESFVKGFGHESEMSPYRSVGGIDGKGEISSLWEGMLEGFPPSMNMELHYPALMLNKCTTFLYWWSPSENKWITGVKNMPQDNEYLGAADMSEDLLGPFNNDESEFVSWAVDYCQNDDNTNKNSIELFKALFNHRETTPDLMKLLAPNITNEQVAEIKKFPNQPR